MVKLNNFYISIAYSAIADKNEVAWYLSLNRSNLGTIA